MEITRTALIIVGCIAIILFFAVLLHLVMKFFKNWKGKSSNKKYHLLTTKYQKTRRKTLADTVHQKISVSFPTSSLPIQFSQKELDSDEIETKGRKDSIGQKLQHQHLQQQQPQQPEKSRRRKYGIMQDSRSIGDLQIRREKRIVSDTELALLEYNTTSDVERDDSNKRRIKSEQQKERGRSVLQVVPELSGQIIYSVFINDAKNEVEIRIDQIIDINEISPELFRGRFPIFVIGEIPLNAEKPYLLDNNYEQLTFSDPDQLGFCVELMKFPNKEHICTTEYKFGMESSTFDETFTTSFKSLYQLQRSLIRLQVLLRYGEQPQMPVILGETVLPLNKCDHGLQNTFCDALKLPMNEKALESIAMEHAGIGKIVISLHYQLLHQHLTVRIVEAIYNDRFGIQLPSTSIKVGVYLCGCRIFKVATDVIKKSRNPQFQKSFDFKLSLDQLENTGILLEVQHHGHMQRSIMGYVHIGLKAGRKGRDYWRKVLGFSEFNSSCALEIQTVKPVKIC